MDFYWNYRVVNVPSDNGGDDWYCLKEVSYDPETNKPTGYGDPCLGSESMETFGDVWHMMEEAMKLPPLQQNDFDTSKKDKMVEHWGEECEDLELECLCCKAWAIFNLTGKVPLEL